MRHRIFGRVTYNLYSRVLSFPNRSLPIIQRSVPARASGSDRPELDVPEKANGYNARTSSSTLSARSHVNSGSSRPKWPYAEVRA